MKAVLLETLVLCGLLAARIPAQVPAKTGAKEPSLDSTLVNYADRVRSTADSGYLLTEPLSPDETLASLLFCAGGNPSAGWLPPDSIASRARRARDEIPKRLLDFDVVSPPPVLDRIHNQLLDALRVLAARADILSNARRLCAEERTTAIGPLTAAVQKFADARDAYLDARKRLTGILVQSRVQLAPIEDWRVKK